MFASKNNISILSLRLETLIRDLEWLPHQKAREYVMTRQETQKNCAQSKPLLGIIGITLCPDLETNDHKHSIQHKVQHDSSIACSGCAPEQMNVSLLSSPENIDKWMRKKAENLECINDDERDVEVFVDIRSQGLRIESATCCR